MSNPAVSVVMPVFNGERYLRAAVESILNQTFRHFEFIIIDDGSTDKSLAILHEYASRDLRIRLVSRPRTGYVAALNEMLGLARGDLIARMDADDVAHPGRFRQQFEFLRNNPAIVCAGSAFDIIDERSCRLTRLRPPEDDAGIQDLLLKGHTAICHPSAMIRAGALQRICGYREAYTTVEDLDLFLRLGEIGQLANLSRALLRYRIHTSSVSGSAGDRQRELARDVCASAWKRRGLTDVGFEASDAWRPGPQRSSRFEFALRYGWWAWQSGERSAAMRYGARAAALMPWRTDGWVLLASAALKPTPWPLDRHAPAEPVVPSTGDSEAVRPVAGEVIRADSTTSDAGASPDRVQRKIARRRPRITVLMPVFNAEKFLKMSIESILDQTLDDFEFLIVDDGSTDSSPLLLRQYAGLDSRIRILGRERGGYIAALNHGLEYARARYIARLDADDIAEPARLELQVDRLDSDENLVAIGACAHAIDPSGRLLGAFDVPLAHEEIEARHLIGESSIHHPAVMMRRQALERVGRYRNGFAPAEDFDLWLRLGEIGRLANLPERLISKRLTTSGVVGSTLWLQADVVRWALDDAWKRRGLPGVPPDPVRMLHTEGDLYRQWGWLAVRNHSLAAARLYAARSIMRDPLHEHSWRLAYCALRGR